MFKICLVVTFLGVAVASPTTKSLGEIVGGKDIDISEAPHQVSLEFRGRFNCGGSIIAKYLIVTAAHCNLEGSSPYDHKVRAGSSFYGKGGELYQVRKFLNHPQYNPKTLNNDIAVIYLATPLKFSKNVAPINLFAKGENVPDGAETIVTGFGRIREGGPQPSKLQMVKVPKVNDEICKRAHAPIYTITPSMICAGVGGKAACKGDSGGPLVYRNKLAGVVSWSIGCARPNYPTVYAKVSALRPWLDSVIQLAE